jgi:predicted nucleic acid-binding protein
MIKAISHTSPIIGLSMIRQLDLLWKLFDIYIPQEVYNEVVLEGSENAIGKHELRNAVVEGYIKIHEVVDQDFVNKAYGRLHRGELEVIVAAKEIEANVVIIDEKSARNFAETLMLRPLGLLGILKLAKSRGLISEMKPSLAILVEQKYRISEKLINETLQEVGE